METTVCASRILAEDPDTESAIDWFLWSMDVDPFTGRVRGIREWPKRGGILRQPAKLVSVADLLIGEWAYVFGGESK